jgi:hypothetical protein
MGRQNSNWTHIWRTLTVLYMKTVNICDHIWLSSSENEKYFTTKLQRKSKHLFDAQQFFFRKSYRSWDNVEKCAGDGQATDDNMIWRMRFECWVTKATGTHSECRILTAFPHWRWLREGTSLLCYSYICCVGNTKISNFYWPAFCFSRSSFYRNEWSFVPHTLLNGVSFYWMHTLLSLSEELNLCVKYWLLLSLNP